MEEQPLLETVTFIFPVICEAVLFVAVKTGMDTPDPLAPKPIVVLLFVQLKVLLDIELVKDKGPTLAPAQT